MLTHRPATFLCGLPVKPLFRAYQNLHGMSTVISGNLLLIFVSILSSQELGKDKHVTKPCLSPLCCKISGVV
jgi:hypothetical protein